MWTYDADLVRVIDGDTVVLRLHKEFSFDVDFGFYIKEQVRTNKTVELSFRLLGINAPEIVGATSSEGKKSKAELERILNLGKIKATTFKPDKYGRWLVNLEVTTDKEVLQVNDLLVKNGFAEVYL